MEFENKVIEHFRSFLKSLYKTTIECLLVFSIDTSNNFIFRQIFTSFPTLSYVFRKAVPNLFNWIFNFEI